MRANGSAGGHNGLKSIEHHLKSRDYPRLRIGIKPLEEQRAIGDLSDFVLGPFGKGEKQVIDELMPTIRAAVETFIGEGITVAMNRFNVKAQ